MVMGEATVEATVEAMGEAMGEAMVAEEAMFLQCTRHIPEEATAAAEVIRDMDIPDLRLILPSTMVRKNNLSQTFASKLYSFA